MKRGWYFSGWVDQQSAVLHQEDIDMTVASCSHVHCWPLCTGCQGLRAISYLFLFESPSQLSKSPPLFLAFDISACFYTINPLSSASQEPLQVLQCVLWNFSKKNPKCPHKVKLDQEYLSVRLFFFFSISAVKFWKYYWSNCVPLESSERDYTVLRINLFLRLSRFGVHQEL